MGLFSSLNREQKETIGLLQIGTFLEYFDLMLYVHMAVILNELFFPKTDPQTSALLAAFAFCSTYVLRPIGALLFGWLGDNIGRKSTIVLTTVIMAISCIVMANLPTYAQVGITAGWIMTICRMAQGMSSMGEIIGAEIYAAESFRRPMSYLAVSLISVASTIGGMAALGVATLVTSFLLNWRLAFWIGAIIAIVGAIARTRLRETPDFLAMKRQQMQETIAQLNQEVEKDNENKLAASQQTTFTWKEPVSKKTLLSYFFTSCGYPLSFYLAFIYFNPILSQTFGYSPEEIIRHNFVLSIIAVIANATWGILGYFIHPIRLVKIRGTSALLLMLCLPFLINGLDSPLKLFLLQSLILLLTLGVIPAAAVFIYHLPIYRRFTFASFLYALSRALMYIFTSFGLVYLGSHFGSFGLWFITLPLTGLYLYGVRHFEGLERKIGIYPNLFRKAVA